MVLLLKTPGYDPITVSQMGFTQSADSVWRRNYTLSAGH